MAVLSNPIPAYRTRNHRGKMRALVTLSDAQTGKRSDIYLGEPDTPESRQAYARTIAEWEASGRRLIKSNYAELSVVLLVDAYWTWAKARYTPGEQAAIKLAWTVWVELYGFEPITAMGPNKMRNVRDVMVRKGWCRKSINRQVRRLVRIMRWGASREMIPADIYQRCSTLEALQPGESAAAERAKVRCAPEAMVEAIKPYVSDQVWAMIQLQRLTGARPGEIMGLRPCDLDRTSDVWKADLEKHKNAWRGQSRTLYFGPQAQAVLAPYLLRSMDQPCFSPTDAERVRRAKLEDARVTPPGLGNESGTNRVDTPQWTMGSQYDRHSYSQAILRACDKAFPPPPELARGKVSTGPKRTRWETKAEWRARLGATGWASLEAWRIEHRWHPHQLRHNCGTRLRRDFGAEMARAGLGHETLDATEIYAEADAQQIESVFRRVG